VDGIGWKVYFGTNYVQSFGALTCWKVFVFAGVEFSLSFIKNQLFDWN
jgi:hypothetical protein